MALDFRKMGDPDLLEKILVFNQLLFQQISSKHDEELNFFPEKQKFTKNYMLVPLRITDPDMKAGMSYKIDFDVIENFIKEDNWLTLQEYLDSQRFDINFNNYQTCYSKIKTELKDCVFFDRFDVSKCFSVYDILPSVVTNKQEFRVVFPNYLKEKVGEEAYKALKHHCMQQIGHEFVSEEELTNYILGTVYGRKKQIVMGASLQDQLYIHPNRPQSIN